MIKVIELIAGVNDLNGWRQNEDPNGVQLTEMTDSVSGLFYNDIHPLLSFDALMSIYEDKEIVYSTWLVGSTYSIGDKVVLTGVNYYSLTNTNIGNSPASSPTNWKVFNSFSLWLKEKTEAALVQTVNDWLNMKFAGRSAENLLEDDQLFRSSGNFQVEISSPTKRTVGFEIKPIRSMGLTFRLREIGLHALDDSMTIKLFKTNQDAEVDSTVITTIGSVPEWKTVKWDLEAEATYLLVYDTFLKTSDYYNDVKDFNQFEDGAINYPGAQFADIKAIQFDGAPSVPDLSTIEYITDDNFGLNIRFDVRCDYTEFVINQRHLFQMSFLRKVGITFLKLFAYNPNAQNNRYISRFGLNDLLFEIYGDTQSTKPNSKIGLFEEYTNDLVSLKIDRRSISKYCLPCRESIINFTSVF